MVINSGNKYRCEEFCITVGLPYHNKPIKHVQTVAVGLLGKTTEHVTNTIFNVRTPENKIIQIHSIFCVPVYCFSHAYHEPDLLGVSWEILRHLFELRVLHAICPSRSPNVKALKAMKTYYSNSSKESTASRKSAWCNNSNHKRMTHKLKRRRLLGYYVNYRHTMTYNRTESDNMPDIPSDSVQEKFVQRSERQKNVILRRLKTSTGGHKPSRKRRRRHTAYRESRRKESSETVPLCVRWIILQNRHVICYHHLWTAEAIWFFVRDLDSTIKSISLQN